MSLEAHRSSATHRRPLWSTFALSDKKLQQNMAQNSGYLPRGRERESSTNDPPLPSRRALIKIVLRPVTRARLSVQLILQRYMTHFDVGVLHSGQTTSEKVRKSERPLNDALHGGACCFRVINVHQALLVGAIQRVTAQACIDSPSILGATWILSTTSSCPTLRARDPGLHRPPSHALSLCASEFMYSTETPWKDNPPTRGRPARRVWPRPAVLSPVSHGSSELQSTTEELGFRQVGAPSVPPRPLRGPPTHRVAAVGGAMSKICGVRGGCFPAQPSTSFPTP